ncbi:hypothetical protein M8818_001578 [Zalaria obscura]|uniref:Uncharacterized protein n=1 Tax=Zalaria obscura TaxID=2024903 RepID=A0ACC3SKR8_9PEZI
MSSNNAPLRLPPRPRSPQEQRSQSTVSRRSTSSMSVESPDSQANAFPVQKRSPYMHPPVRPSTAGGPSSSTASLQNFSRPAARQREEKAAAAGLTPILSNSSANLPLRDTSFSIEQRGEFVGPSSLESTSVFGPPTASTTSIFSFPSLEQSASLSQAAFNNLGNTMGLTGITPDDAWPLLKARLLNIFEGEDLRTPIEDFNMLVSVHILRCVQKRAPVVLIEDLRELLQTGFSSIAQTLRRVPDDRLVQGKSGEEV